MSAELFSVKTIKFKNTGTKTKGQDGKVRVSKDTVRVEIMGHEIEVPFEEGTLVSWNSFHNASIWINDCANPVIRGPQ